MNKLDRLLDQIEAVYHTPAIGAIRMELADLRRERDSWQALAAAADADARALREVNSAALDKAEQERDAARAEVEALKHDIARHVQITSEQAQEIEQLRALLRDFRRFISIHPYPTADEIKLNARIAAAIAGKDQKMAQKPTPIPPDYWIPVTQSLPTHSGVVLALFAHRPNLENRVVCAYWTGNEWGPYRARQFPITHWMPLPEMPDGYYP